MATKNEDRYKYRGLYGVRADDFMLPEGGTTIDDLKEFVAQCATRIERLVPESRHFQELVKEMRKMAEVAVETESPGQPALMISIDEYLSDLPL